MLLAHRLLVALAAIVAVFVGPTRLAAAAPDNPPELLPAPAKLLAADFWSSPQASADELISRLGNFTEVAIGSNDELRDKTFLKTLANRIEVHNAAQADGFILKLKKTRPDLAGLPFAMGDDCRLSPAAAKTLARHSLQVTRMVSTSTTEKLKDPEKVELFWRYYLWESMAPHGQSAKFLASGSPALEQALSVQTPAYRASFVEKVAEAGLDTRILARRALFDFDPAVRQLAVEALA